MLHCPPRKSRLQAIFADGECAGKLIDWVTQIRSRVRLEKVPKLDGQHEFKVLRWIVERSFD